MSVDASPTNIALTPASPLGAHAVALGLAAWLLSDLSTRAFAANLPEALRDLGLPEGSEGLPAAIAGLTTTFAAIPMGWLADRIAGKQLLLVGLLLAAAASALALIGSGALFGIVTLLYSVAAVLLPPVVVKLLRLLAQDIRGACIGVMLGLSTGGGASYYLVTFQLGAVSGWGWRAVYVVTLAAMLLIAVLVMTTFRAPGEPSEVQTAAPTLPTGAVLHLSAAGIVLAALGGGIAQLAAKLLSDLQVSGSGVLAYSTALALPIPFSVIGAITAAFLHGPRAHWLSRLTIGAACTCLAALLLAAVTAGTALAWYALTVAMAGGAFAFAANLSMCACWAADNLRGVLTGLLFAAKQLLGAIFGAILFAFASDSKGPAYVISLLVVALTLCAWSIWHARRAEQTLRTPPLESPVPA
jgi:MFS family permease